MAVALKHSRPALYAVLRRAVVPFLRTYPSIDVWHAGCGSPDEPYWTAMALFEDDVYERTRIYVTDPDERTLSRAIARGRDMNLARLRERMTFFVYDTATDASFKEFQLIVARGSITERALALFRSSSCRLGLLCLDENFSLEESQVGRCYESLDRPAGLYRRMR